MEVAELNVNQSTIYSQNMEMQRLTDFNKTECVQRIQIVQGLWSLGTKDTVSCQWGHYLIDH